MKSLKRKLMTIICGLLAVIIIGLGASSFWLSVIAQKTSCYRDLKYIAEQTADIVTKEIEGKLSTLEAIANRPEIHDPNVSIDKKVKVLAGEVKTAGSIRLNYIDTKGIVYSSDKTSFNASDRAYYIEGMKGNTYVADPLYTKLRNELVVIYAVPIRHNGKVIGVLTGTCDGNELGRIANGNKFGKSGKGFIVNKDGNMIANADIKLVQDKYNVIADAKKNSKAESKAEFVKKMLDGKAFVGNYTSNNVKYIAASAPVSNYHWYVGVEMTKEEVYQDINQLFYSIIILAIVFIAIGVGVAIFIAKNLSTTVVAVSDHMSEIATGNFTGRLSEKQLAIKDEIGTMSVAIDQMQSNIAGMITTIKDTSFELSSSSVKLKGDSEEIRKLSDAISTAISEIAEGTTVQASELVRINKLLSEFNKQLNQMSQHAVNVEESSKKIDTMAAKSSDEMNVLNESVTEVSASFETFQEKINKLGLHIKEINNITNMIAEIANETNLLALNASIEAARAGDAGKGFAVVAGEIGSLAEQSKESTISITQLIQGIGADAESLIHDSDLMRKEMDGQVGTIRQTISSFELIIDEVNQMQPKIAELKESTMVIEENKNVIIGKIDELSAVSEEISASSQEITASTDEMNNSIIHVADAASQLNVRTEDMKKQVEKFQVD